MTESHNTSAINWTFLKEHLPFKECKKKKTQLTITLLNKCKILFDKILLLSSDFALQ